MVVAAQSREVRVVEIKANVTFLLLDDETRAEYQNDLVVALVGCNKDIDWVKSKSRDTALKNLCPMLDAEHTAEARARALGSQTAPGTCSGRQRMRSMVKSRCWAAGSWRCWEFLTVANSVLTESATVVPRHDGAFDGAFSGRGQQKK